MPGFTGTGNTQVNGSGQGPNDVPRDQHDRYLIPRYPLDRPLTQADGKIKGEGMAQPWTRVSTLAKATQDNFGINRWEKRMIVKGIGVRPDLYALAAATRVDSTSTLDSIAEQAKEAARARAASNLGTALHSFTDQVDAGETPEVPAPWDQDVAAYVQALQDNGIQLIPGLQEMRVVCPDLADGKAAGAGGTFDRIVMWKGRPTVADLKTGSNPLKYGDLEISIQLGRYATAWAMWDGEFFLPMPEGIRTDKALVIHLAAGTGLCQVYEVELDPGHEAVKLALAVRAWRAQKGKLHTRLDVVSVSGTPVEAVEVPGIVVDEEATPDSSIPRTPQMEADAALAAERQAVAAKVVTAELDRSQPIPGPGAEVNLEKPKRTCSVCRQPGHRAGSPKCPGKPEDVAPEEQIHYGQATCSHAKGWTRDPMVGWVCASCGAPAAEPKREELDETEARVDANAVGTPAHQAAVAEALGMDEEDAQAVREHIQEVATAEPEDDPFADEEPAAPPAPSYLERINSAPDKAAIRAIREEAKAAGEWTHALLQAGLARIETLGS